MKFFNNTASPNIDVSREKDSRKGISGRENTMKFIGIFYSIKLHWYFNNFKHIVHEIIKFQLLLSIQTQHELLMIKVTCSPLYVFN